jgi:glycosidase
MVNPEIASAKRHFALVLSVGLMCLLCVGSGTGWASAGAGIQGDDRSGVRSSPVSHPQWSYSASIYEVNVRQYSPGGTFKEFEAHLPRLNQLGVDILWLMPIHPIGLEKRKGTLGSYYSVRDYHAVNPEFGTLEDFRGLVRKIHDTGMYVIIDWVANHCAWDNPLTALHPEWFTQDVHGNLVSPNDDWTDVVDFNYNNPELRRYMIDAMAFWIEDVGVDGFRCDVAGMVPTEFWNDARCELDKIRPVFMLAEWETPELHEYAFDMTYGWDLHHVMQKLAKGQVPATAIGVYLDREAGEYPGDAYRMYFTSNHDVNSWSGTVFERLGDAAQVLAVLTTTLDGMPLIYSGQEAGLDRRLEFFEKDEILWKEHELSRLYSTLLNLKHENRAMWNGDSGGDVTWVHTSDDAAVFAFVRKRERDKVFVIANLTGSQRSVGLSGKAFVGGYTDIFSVEPPYDVYFGGEETIDLGPWGYKVYAYPAPERLDRMRKAEEDLGQLVSLMTGSFSSQEQAGQDTTYFDIRLEMVPIWRERTDGYWLYVEQAVATKRDRPYRQRVYHLTAQDDGTVRSDVYSIPDPLRFAGAWQDSVPLAGLIPDSLSIRPGCAVVLKRAGFGVFKGSTVDKECVSDLHGASYATSEVKITPQELMSWDRGFDAEGNQVWGATEGGYVFKRLE